MTRASSSVAPPGCPRYAPGVAQLRRYDRSWLRPDLVAGLVLAAILVPQGMAYAELAGLPAVTGLYTTIACLVGYALFGPSRVLVLGPDSSISPLILASITPLLVVGDPAVGDRPGGHARDLRRPDRDRPRPRQARVRRRPALQGGAGRLHERPRDHDHRRAAAEAVRLLDRRRLLPRRAEGVRGRPRPDPRRHARARARASSAVLLVLPASHQAPAGDPRRESSPPPSSPPPSASPTTGSRRSGPCPRECPRPAFPGRSASDVGPLLLAALGITLVSLTDTIATATSFAARRGEEVKPDQEMIGVGAANVAAGFFQGFAVSTSGSSTAVAEQSGAKTQLTGLVGRRAGRPAAALPQLAARRPAAGGARGGGHRRGAVADEPARCCAATTRSAEARSASPWWPPPASCFLGVLQGIVVAVAAVDPPLLPPQLVAAWRGAGRVEGRGWHERHVAGPRRRAGAGHRRLPLGGAPVLRQLGPVPPSEVRRLVRERRPAGSSCSARRSPTSTSPRRRCSSSSTASSTRRASTSPSSSCATASTS